MQVQHFLSCLGSSSRPSTKYFFLTVHYFSSVFPSPSRLERQSSPGHLSKFAEIFASQGAPPVSMTPVANCRRYQRHRRQIYHRYQRHRRQTLPPVSLVLLKRRQICRRCQRRRWQICHRYQRHRWQIIRTISGCRHLKLNLKAKMYIRVQ